MERMEELTLEITAADYDRLMGQSPDERRNPVEVAIGPIIIQVVLYEVGWRANDPYGECRRHYAKWKQIRVVASTSRSSDTDTERKRIEKIVDERMAHHLRRTMEGL